MAFFFSQLPMDPSIDLYTSNALRCSHSPESLTGPTNSRKDMTHLLVEVLKQNFEEKCFTVVLADVTYSLD